MASLDNVVQQLRESRNQAQLQVEKLQKAISVIEGLEGRRDRGAINGARRPKRTLSAAARRRIAEAQRARWAKLRKPPQPAASTAKSSVSARTPAKRRLSPEGRRKIIAAAKARWARVRAQQAKKAA
jgi:hypothetical protein